MSCHILYVDATEPGEPMCYLFDGSDAPRHMRTRMRESETKTFEHIDEENLSGLVDEDRDDAEQRGEEIIEYLEEKSIPENQFKPGRPGLRVDYYISRSQS